MKNNEELLLILKKYAEGKCSPEEDRFIRSWLYENIDGREYDDLFEKFLDSCDSAVEREKVEASYRRLENGIASMRGVSGRRGRTWFRRGLLFSLAAASIAAVLFLVIHVLGTPQADTPEIAEESALHTFHVPAGSNADFRLPDGTILKLNSATTVRYPEKFSGPERRIYIDGEAYLDVAPDSRHPFIVTTDHFNVKVHGTEFNVNTHGTEMPPYVVLAKGSVEVSDVNGTCMIEPGMMAVAGQNGIVTRNVNVEEYICWKDRYIILNGMNISTISTRLSLYYGVPVDFVGVDSHLYGKLDLTDDIRNVFENISKILPVNVRRVEEGYQLSTKH